MRSVPRSRRRYRAEDIVARMVTSLRYEGPATMPDLLGRLGYDPTRVRRLAKVDPRVIAAVHMAVRDLVKDGHPVALTASGRLRYHERGSELPAQDRATRRSSTTDRKARGR